MSSLEKDTYINLLAIGRLYEFSSSKRFHLIKSEFLDDSIGRRALEINYTIKSEKGLDIFEATSENELIQYESLLNVFTTNESKAIVKNIQLGDETKLLEFQTDFSIDKMNEYAIVPNRNIKPILKKYSLNAGDIIKACRSADKISLIKEFGSIFLVKRIKIKNRSKALFVHLTFDNSNETYSLNPADSYENEYFGLLPVDQDNFLNSKTVRISMVFLFDLPQYEAFTENPVRLFIRGLDLFGEAMTIGTERKKFFYKVLIPAYVNVDSIQDYLRNLFPPYIKQGDIRYIVLSNTSKIQLQFTFLYAVNISKIP